MQYSPYFPCENDWCGAILPDYLGTFLDNIFTVLLISEQLKIGATKPIPLNTFRDCLSKRLNIQLSRRDRSNGKNVRYYTFGNNPDDVIDMLKQKSLYNEI